jgi:hypothetical protein
VSTQPLSEGEFKRRIYEKHKEYFDHLYRLHEFAEQSLINSKSLAAGSYESALQLILPRAFKSYDAIRRLCEAALCEDAGVVLRSLMNLTAVTRWISLDPQKRAKRFLDWHWIEMHHTIANFQPTWAPAIEKGYAEVRPQFEYKDRKGRARVADRWYQPEAKTIRCIFEQVGLEKQYEEGYKILSGVEHADVTAFFAMFAEAELAGQEWKLAVHSELFLRPYLRNAFQFFADVFGTCNVTLHIADATRLREIVSGGINFYKADMQARGTPRN